MALPNQPKKITQRKIETTQYVAKDLGSGMKARGLTKLGAEAKLRAMTPNKRGAIKTTRLQKPFGK